MKNRQKHDEVRKAMFLIFDLFNLKAGMQVTTKKKSVELDITYSKGDL